VSDSEDVSPGDRAARPLEISASADPIAIVGIGCRYADARGPKEFWDIVQSGRDTVREAPQHRIDLGYDIDHFYDPRPRIPGKIASKKAGFVEHPELFDPAAFGIAPRDALTMEPQQRLMVEVTWDALEDAGIVPESIAGERVAVILGYMAEDYSRERSGVLGENAVFRGHDVFTVGGMSHAVLSGRISYLLGLTGPSFTLDTACSSSLIATHLACQSIRRGESKMAIAGGVNIFLTPEGNIALSRSGMLSLSGACKAFDASADGFVRAEGAGVVVLRPLADAIEEGNPIYAVIRGSGISTDGRDGGHMMAPGRHGQAQAMRDAYAQAGVAPSEIHYVETHGTGTMIGDPVEIAALADVMGAGRDADRPLRVASVKGNLGHAESASGIAGLINAALAIHHRRLPAQLHFETPNPAIPWGEIPIRVQAKSEPWPYSGPARAGVNSFGISGTNAHVVLESPPEPSARSAPSSSSSSRPALLPITGHDSKSLHAMAELYRDSENDPDDRELDDLAYTLGRRRTHRPHRLTVVAESPEEMRRELDAYLEGNPFTSVRAGVASRDPSAKLVMVFPGQGGQWLGMGRRLLESESVFEDSIDRLDAAYGMHVDWSLRAMIDGSAGIDWTTRLDVLQPLLVAVEIALAELWESWGIRPDRVIGQSMGEIAAAYVAGCLDLDDMARLAYHRGRVVASASGQGAMAVVSLPGERVEEVIRSLGGRVEVAGSNSPSTTIVSGDRDAVTSLVATFEEQGVFTRLLEVDFASHCFHMDPLLDPFRAGIKGIEARPARVPFDSTVDGCEVAGENLGPEYWVRNLRAAVAFDRGLEGSIQAGGQDFLEVSPHPMLSRAIEEVSRGQGTAVSFVSSLQRDQEETRCLLISLGELFTRGIDVDFEALSPDGRVVETPLYAYQRKRFWFGERNRSHRFRPVHPLLGARSQSSIDARLHSWDFLLDEDSADFIADYRVDGQPGAPAAIYPEIALAAASALWPGAAISVERIEFTTPLVLGVSGRRFVQAVMRVEGEHCGELRVSSREREEAPWDLHAICQLSLSDASKSSFLPASLERTEGQSLALDTHFSALERCGISLGPKCRTLRELELEAPGEKGDNAEGSRENEGTLLARMMLPRVSEAEWYAYHAHPAIVENCFQLVGALLEPATAVRPIAVGRITLEAGLGSDCWVRVRRRALASGTRASLGIIEADLEFFDREGASLGLIESVQVEALPARAGNEAGAATDVHQIGWVASDLLASLAEKEVRRWLVVSDSAEQAFVFAAEMQKEGASCHFCEKVEDLPRLADRMRAKAEDRPWGFLLLAWGDVAVDGKPEPASYRDYRVATWAGAIRDHCKDAAHVWVATRGLQRVRPDDGESSRAARLIAQEVETFASSVDMQQSRLFDASAALDDAERRSLIALLGRDCEERQFAARGEEVFVPRLIGVADRRRGESTVLAEDRNFQVFHTGREGLECLVVEEIVEPELAPGCVAVEVRSAALSQFDVLTGLGLARGPVEGPGRVGSDFSGVVTAVADSGGPFDIGDEVIGICDGALARRLAVPVASLAPKPAFFDFNEAASLPFPYMVAQYALQVVARLRAGERVLISSASGGVGQAMIAVARSLGAEVSTTASSETRRKVLRELGARVLDGSVSELDAKSADFDVIVTSESGSNLHSTLERLAPGGRYLDLCPRSDFVRPEMGALRLASNRSVSAIDIGAMMRSEPSLVSALLERTAKDASEGRLRPPTMTVFALPEAARAMRYMAQNRHVGRVVVDLGDVSKVSIRSRAERGQELADRGAFVISGSEPKILSSIAQWLRDHGASSVVESTSEGLAAAFSDRDAARLGGWIHVTSELARGSEEIERITPALDARDVDFRAILCVRPPLSGDSTADRAWETRTWIDRLLLANSVQRSRVATLSVGDDLAPDRVADLIGRAVVGRESVAELVALSENDLARRLGETASPFLSLVERPEAPRGGSTLVVAEFLQLAPPERRVVMQQFVCGALAGVLALSEEQRTAIDIGSRIDEMGLDSLMTLELFLGLGRDLELEIASNWFGTSPTLAEIASVLVERLEEIEAETAS
jgi:acyl transferase domain-containing protein/NADPH:quinone reductase-like Zn-dependent oxidoreductase/acyl carrier protein